MPLSLKELLESLFVMDPIKRWKGTQESYDNLRKHAFFEGINWEELLHLDPSSLVNFDLHSIRLKTNDPNIAFDSDDDSVVPIDLRASKHGSHASIENSTIPSSNQCPGSHIEARKAEYNRESNTLHSGTNKPSFRQKIRNLFAACAPIGPPK
jgi:hypothetical protein